MGGPARHKGGPGGLRAPRPLGSLRRPGEGEPVGWGGRRGSGCRPAAPPRPEVEAGCVLDSCVFKSRQMGSKLASLRRSELPGSLQTAVCGALDSQARGRGARAASARARAPGPRAGQGLEERGSAPPPWALQSQGPADTAGGVEAWPLAAQGQALAPPRGGLGTAWLPRQLRGRPDPGPPTSSWQPATRSRVSTPTLSPGPSRHGGSIIHGAPGRAPKTCSALGFPGEVGRGQGKSSQSKVGHGSQFPPK